MSNPWDTLSGVFNTNKKAEEISPAVADNMLIAWPVVLDFIKKFTPEGKQIRVLEYGCGAGGFAAKLFSLGYHVTGIDSSEGMIRIANASYGKQVTFLVGNSFLLATLSPFHIITSIMTLQFIEEIETTFDDFSKVLLPGGILVFAVHNPDFVQDCLQEKMLFEDFDSKEQPKTGVLNLGGNKIPIFIRTAEEYSQLLQSRGFEPLLEKYPPFTKEFLKKYPMSVPTNHSEFLILGYRKKQ